MNCPYCQQEAVWTENKAIYGRNYGKSVMCYYCAPCNAYVGCHENSRRPLGTMANAELREWRKRAHAIFDPLWRNKRGGKRRHSRGQLYLQISTDFGKEIHIGESDIETCKAIIQWCQKRTVA